METFLFNRVQRGFWGQTILNTIKVKAANEAEAQMKVSERKDYLKRLRNGDTISYDLQK